MRIQKTLAPLLGGDTLKTYTITQLSKHETKQLKKITPNNITFNFIFQFNPVCIEFDLTRTSILFLLHIYPMYAVQSALRKLKYTI